MKSIITIALVMLLTITNPAFAAEEQNQNQNGNFNEKFDVVALAGPENVEFELLLNNDGNVPLTFEFRTSQKYEIKVTDSKGKEVYVFSEGKMFTQAIEHVTLKPGETKTWREEWNYVKDGKRVEEGEYKVRAELLAVSINNKEISNKNSLKAEVTMFIPGINPVFQNVKVSGKNGIYTVTGEARPTAGDFYYTVEDGHNQYVEETKVKHTSKFPNWNDFKLEINIDKDKLPTNATLILNLYEKSSEDGSIIHTFPVVLQQFS